jgi:hypothetical protein
MGKEPFLAAKEEIIQRGVKSPPVVPQVVIGVVLCVVLFFLRSYNYLFFHVAIELFTIAIVWAVFILVWNLRLIVSNNYLLVIGIGLAFVSCIDLLHTIAYKNMNIFSDVGANLSAQLWISARYTESLTFLVTPLFIGIRLRLRYFIGTYVVVVTTLLFAIFVWKTFPVCYIDAEQKLSTFKIVSEYVISGILFCSILILMLRRNFFNRDVLSFLIAALACKIAAELCFTLYTDVFGFFNFIGHYLKFVSFYIIYYALIRASIIRPFNAIFRELSASELRLVTEKEKLSEVLENIKTLSGLLPICSNCRRVRDDRGYWSKIEDYVASHSGTQFSHGLCPDCAKSMYPDLVGQELDGCNERHL